ncbi:MAG: hypothetical protein ABI844_06980, partial [Saprospiraceae bacterium]
MIRLLLIVLFSVIALFSKAQVCTLICKPKVNAAMPADLCELSFSYYDFIQNPESPCKFEVSISYPFGTATLSGYNVNKSHLGYNMVYKVIDLATGNSCWGYLTIEDKSGPPVPCKSATISCFQVGQINKVTNETEDACSGNTSKVTTKLTWQDYGCDSVGKIGIVIRDILASDSWGNNSNCTDTLTIRKDVLDSVCCPSTITLPCRVYCLNGNKILKSIQSTTIPFLQIFNVANWDLYQFSKDKNSPNYPTPERLLAIQGYGDPLVELGITPGRLAVTEILLDNIDIPDLIINGGFNPDRVCIPRDSLVVPALADSALDLNKVIAMWDINDDLTEVNLNFEPNPNYCKQVKKKTLMYPALGGFCKLVVSYSDEILPVCGAGFKIRREWKILDWCTQKEKICVQYIAIEDSEGPALIMENGGTNLR